MGCSGSRCAASRTSEAGSSRSAGRVFCRGRPGRVRDPVARPARPRPLEHEIADPVGTRRRVLITGAGGQLGRALTEAFAGDEVVPLTSADWDVRLPPPSGFPVPDLVLHAAA